MLAMRIAGCTPAGISSYCVSLCSSFTLTAERVSMHDSTWPCCLIAAGCQLRRSVMRTSQTGRKSWRCCPPSCVTCCRRHASFRTSFVLQHWSCCCLHQWHCCHPRFACLPCDMLLTEFEQRYKLKLSEDVALRTFLQAAASNLQVSPLIVCHAGCLDSSAEGPDGGTAV